MADCRHCARVGAERGHINACVANGDMACLGRNRKGLPAPRGSWCKGHTAVHFPSALRRSFCALVYCATLFACGTGWARPYPYRRSGYFRATGWYQARQGRAGEGQGYLGERRRFIPEENARQHLGSWLRQHQNMPLAAQERALRNEPGFNRLPPATQQRLFSRLQQLNAMPPAQRELTLERLETWERLSPAQRQQVRNGIQQVHQMPPGRRQMMRTAIRDLSEFPPSQRQSVLNSPDFLHRYSPHERQILGNIMMAQPYTPLRSRR